MSKQHGEIGCNDCFVTDNVMSSARNLITGFPLTPINFADLCELIEMCVIHDRIVMTLPTFRNSPLEDLLSEGIVTSTMFKDATPLDEAEKQLLQNIYKLCLRTLQDGASFGRGIIDKPESHDVALRQALTRIEIAEMILGVEHGRREVAPDAKEGVHEIREIYQVFKDYADAVFDAAQHFHVHAYFGTSELPYSIEKTIRSIPLSLYDELRKIHKDRVDQFLISAGYKSYDIPPFALIVLSRCRSRDDLVLEILKAREEFRKFRETCALHAVRIRDAAQNGTFGDIIDLQNDLEQAIKVLRRKVTTSSKDSRFVYKLWNIVKATSPWGITKNVIDRLQAYDIDRQHLQAINGLMDVWNKLRKGSSYEAILGSDLFPNEFREEDFKAFSTYLRHVQQYLPVGTNQ